MRLLTLQYLAVLTVLAMQVCFTDARGPGGGKSGGGKSGGGKSGGGSFGGGNSGGGNSGGGKSGGSLGHGYPVSNPTYGSSQGAVLPRSGSVSSSGNYYYPPTSRGYTKGGYGSFSGPRPPFSYGMTRDTYRNYTSSYTGGYGTNYHQSGWVGYYNPSLLYWSITPAFFYLGFYSTYHRYNQNEGSYYAPEIYAYAQGANNAIVNASEYTSRQDNYRYSFNMTTGYTYAMADHGFFASSDPEAHPANFQFRTTFSHIIEWNDANQNGFYDEGEMLLAATPLAGLSWQPLTVSKKGVETNATLTYYEIATSVRNLTRSSGGNGSTTPFSMYLTWRSSNLQINETQGVPIQPNSLWYNISLPGYPIPTASNTRLGLAQWITLPTGVTMLLDVNRTTPFDIAQQIKSNQTYGVSIGYYNEARLEYEPAVNITLVEQPPTNLTLIPDDNQCEWIWGDNQWGAYLLLLSVPVSPLSTPQLTGFSFLDVNIMSAEASENEPQGPPASAPVSISIRSTSIRSVQLVILLALCTSFLIS
ncbi:hypothetical protein BX666DRAFT_1923455 [Dichotomocladium elegans]|nr:hypothetical protein BX666DRAFT_1923455 [Dichotomocladium elegans]